MPLSMEMEQRVAAMHARLALRFPARVVDVGGGAQVSVRERGASGGLALVCLHGIGSQAASWLDVAERLAPRTRLIAWDAPGYGESTPLPAGAPGAGDYAERLWALLDAMGVARCVLVGHSLGALVAAPAARRADRVAALVLLSPAQGYGAPGREAERARVRAERLAALDALGIAGTADQRSARLLSPHASPVAREWVRWNMASLHPHGYRQAVELLCGADLLAALPPAVPVTVACGDLDVVTPPAGCAEVARRCGVPLQSIAQAGHACYVEQPDAVAALLEAVLDRAASPDHPNSPASPP